jgi:hypothetical protein
MGYQIDSFDDELHLRLTDLAGTAPAPDAALLPSIKGRAANQRHGLRGAALAVATAVLVAGVGATVVARSVTHRPTTSATVTTPLLGWPTRGGPPVAALSRIVAAWDQGSGTPGHTQARVLYAGMHRSQAIYIVEGQTPGGDARIAVLVSWSPETQRASDPDRPAFQVTMDVPAPTAKPQLLLVALTGLTGPPNRAGRSPGYEQVVIALAAPTAPPVELQVTLRADQPTPVRQTLDPAVGYASMDITGALESFPRSAIFRLVDARGGISRGCDVIKPNSARYDNPKVGDVYAMILIPAGPEGASASASPSR